MGPTSPFWVLPVPTWVANICQLSSRGLLIYCDNFHFHCHGQLSLYKFSNMHPRTHLPTHGKLTYRGGMGPPKNLKKIVVNFLNTNHNLSDTC